MQFSTGGHKLAAHSTERAPRYRELPAYGVALAGTIVAVSARWLLESLLGDNLAFITLFLAVALAAWYGGRGPALLVFVTGAIAVAFFILIPRYSLAVLQLEYRLPLGYR